MSNEDKFKVFLQLYYGFFAVSLLAYPAMFFEETALVPTVMTFWYGSPATVTSWFARSMGNLMAIISIGPNLGVPTTAFFKQQAPLHGWPATHTLTACVPCRPSRTLCTSASFCGSSSAPKASA